MARKTGVVERFMPKRGFGLIAPNDGSESIFVHWSQISSEDSWPQLQVGMEVEFDVGIDERSGKPVAENVTLPGGIPVTDCEDPSRAGRNLSSFKVTGQVLFFKRDQGYGFISCDTDIDWQVKVPAGTHIYVSREDIVCAEGSQCNLAKGMQVEFQVYKPEGKEGLAAAEVTATGGEPVVYEQTQSKGGYGKGKGKAGSWDSKGYGKGYSNGKGKAGSWKGKGKGKDSSSKGGSWIGVQRTIQKPVAATAVKVPAKAATNAAAAAGTAAAARAAAAAKGGAAGRTSLAGTLAVRVTTPAAGKAAAKGAAKGVAKGVAKDGAKGAAKGAAKGPAKGQAAGKAKGKGKSS